MARSRFSILIDIVWTVMVARARSLGRYPGYFVLEAVHPSVLAMVPLLLGRAVGGSSSARAFAENTGAEDPAAFLLLGSIQFVVVGGTIWNLGNWMRRELQMGTLESLCVTPAPRIYILWGVALYSLFRDLIILSVSLLLGYVLFGIQWPLSGVGFAALLVVLGALPLYGMGIFCAALVLRVKEASAVLQIAHFCMAILIGVFTPLHMYPLWLQWLGKVLPAAWVTNSMRAALLDTQWFMGRWYWDIGVIASFAAILPLSAAVVYGRAEAALRRRNGLGEF